MPRFNLGRWKKKRSPSGFLGSTVECSSGMGECSSHTGRRGFQYYYTAVCSCLLLLLNTTIEHCNYYGRGVWLCDHQNFWSYRRWSHSHIVPSKHHGITQSQPVLEWNWGVCVLQVGENSGSAYAKCCCLFSFKTWGFSSFKLLGCFSAFISSLHLPVISGKPSTFADTNIAMLFLARSAIEYAEKYFCVFVLVSYHLLIMVWTAGCES